MPEDDSDRDRLKVFLCHAHADKPRVRMLYRRLQKAGMDPWLDEKGLLAGQDWATEIPRQIRCSHAVIVCLSPESVTKTGFVQKEIKIALDFADEHPEDAIFVMPYRIEDCPIPERLSHLHCEDQYRSGGFRNLVEALQVRARDLGLQATKTTGPPGPVQTHTVGLPDTYTHAKDGSAMVLVAAGEFTMGEEGHNGSEEPKHTVLLAAYYIGVYPVTNAQYRRFVETTSHQPPWGWDGPSSWQTEWFSQPKQPVVGVSWHDAMAYVKWAGLSLATEAQWERAARGTDCRAYPWGNEEPNQKRCNYGRTMDATTEVGSYPDGVSPYGCHDMAGNVWEWTSSTYGPYPYVARDGREDTDDRGSSRVLRGGSWINVDHNCRSAYRHSLEATLCSYEVGLRAALSAE